MVDILGSIAAGGQVPIGVDPHKEVPSGDLVRGKLLQLFLGFPLQNPGAHDESFRKIISVCEDITPDNLDLIKGDVVAIQIAGGNTIPIAAKIIKHAQKRGAKTISTAGIFGFGDETVEVRDISEFEDNPAVDELRKEGITENHLIVTTNKLLRDKEPITPYTLDEVAEQITKTSLKLLKDSYD